jgi:hypothetical protein
MQEVWVSNQSEVRQDKSSNRSLTKQFLCSPLVHCLKLLDFTVLGDLVNDSAHSNGSSNHDEQDDALEPCDLLGLGLEHAFLLFQKLLSASARGVGGALIVLGAIVAGAAAHTVPIADTVAAILGAHGA